MGKQFVTITGMNHYYGMKPFEIGSKIKCEKEPNNKHDREAISCKMKKINKVGYLANSPYTVIRGTRSAAGVAHRVKEKFMVEVLFITRDAAICQVVDGFK